MATAESPSRTFKAFAVVEALRNGSADIRGAVVPFFHPLLAFENGQVFDPTRMAHAANEAYAWNLTADVVEGLLPAFLEQGWLVELERNDQAVVYRVSCHLPDGTFHSHLSDDLKNLAERFHTFVADISPLSGVERSSEDLLNTLLRWIVSLEVFSEGDLKREVVKSSVKGKIAIYDVTLSRAGVSHDEQYLCARFTSSLAEEGSELVKVLGAVARIGLLTEAAQDFAKPITAVRKTSLTIYLDAPVAMDLLDISGTAARDNIRPIVDRIRAIGGSVRIFEDSIEEIRQNLAALFRRPEPLRTGPTANAIRRRQALEPYVREIAARPDRALANLGIQIVSRTLRQFPNDHKYFTEDDFRNFYGKVSWHIEERPRTHDATVVTNVMRMRRGIQSADVFETGHVLVTRNGILPGAARRLAVEVGKLDPYSVGPVVHQRQLATAVWLRAGLGGAADTEIPLRYLLASCERVLQLRPDVIEKVRQQAQSRGKETAEQLDLLLTIDRSTQMLMDKTLNVASVVTSDNFEEVLQGMKESLIAEKTAEHKAELQKVKKSANADVETARREAQEQVERERAEREAAAAAADRATGELGVLNQEDELAVNSMATYVNDVLYRKKRRASLVVSAVTLAADVASVVMAFLYPSVTTVVLVALLTLVLVSHFSGMLERVLPFGDVSEEGASALMWEEAEQRGLTAKLRRVGFSYDGEKIVIGAS